MILIQVLLLWALQQGYSVVPKSTNPHHIAENISLSFELDDQDIDRLNSLSINRKYAWNPETVV